MAQPVPAQGDPPAPPCFGLRLCFEANACKGVLYFILIQSHAMKTTDQQSPADTEEICTCDKGIGRGMCMALIHGSNIYRMIHLRSFEPNQCSYEFRAEANATAVEIAREFALVNGLWFIRVNRIVYPEIVERDRSTFHTPIDMDAERPELDLILVNRTTGEVIDCRKRYMLLNWHTWTVLGYFFTYSDAVKEQNKRQKGTARVCILLTENND